MFQFIAVFLSNTFGVYLYNKKNRNTFFENICLYGFYTSLTNAIILTLYYIKTKEMYPTFTCIFCAKYIIISIIINIILTIIILYINDNFKIKVRRKND